MCACVPRRQHAANSKGKPALIVQWENIRVKIVERVFDSHSGQQGHLPCMWGCLAFSRNTFFFFGAEKRRSRKRKMVQTSPSAGLTRCKMHQVLLYHSCVCEGGRVPAKSRGSCWPSKAPIYLMTLEALLEPFAHKYREQTAHVSTTTSSDSSMGEHTSEDRRACVRFTLRAAAHPKGVKLFSPFF